MKSNGKRKKIYSIISIALFFLFITAGTLVIWMLIGEFNGDPEALKKAIDEYGKGNSILVFILIQVLQIIFPILPGEMIEFSAGYIFDPYMGLLLCEIGILIASVPIFFLVRSFGQKLVSNIFSLERLQSLSFLQNEKRLSLVVFILFFIPGTPKDLLTYFIGLTPIKPLHFIPITLIARIPSILTSTFAGAKIGDGQIYTGIIIYAVTAAISAVGLLIYSRYTKQKSEK